MKPLTICVCFCVLLLSGYAFSQNAKPKVPPATTVLLTDGTAVRGVIVEADRMRLKVQPVAAKPNTPAPEPVTIEWTNIKSVSNGLTRSKAQQDWKKLQDPSSLCATCAGDGLQLCETCKGTTHDPASATDCATCKGEMLVECKTPNCTEGKISCPNKCLKPSRFTGKPEADGKRWITIAGPGGAKARISDGHIGEVYNITSTGMTLEKCPVCRGTTQVDDPVCAAGKQPCPTCIAKTDAPPCTAECDKGKTDCATCKGSGKKS